MAAAGSIPGIVLDGGDMLAVINATLWTMRPSGRG